MSTSVSLVNPSSTASSSNKPVSKSQSIEIAIKTVQGIAKESETRLQTDKFKKGVFYAQDYAPKIKGLDAQYYTQLREKGFFHHGFLLTKFFRPVTVSSGTGRVPYSFVIQKNVLPIEAKKAAKEGLSLLDCGSVCELGLWDLIDSYLGEEKFNSFFGSSSPVPFTIGMTSTDNFFASMPLFLEFSPITDERAVQKGDVVYFQNILVYQIKLTFGNAAGFYVICDIVDGKKVYYGLGISSQGVTSSWFPDALLDAYNQDPQDDLLHTKENQTKIIKEIKERFKDVPEIAFAIDNRAHFKTHKYTKEQFAKSDKGNAGKISQIFGMNWKYLDSLKKATLEEGIQLLQKWKKEKSTKKS